MCKKLLDCLRNVLIVALLPTAILAEEVERQMPVTSERPRHQESAAQHQGETNRLDEIDSPLIPEGMTLKEVLEYSEGSPPSHFPAPLMDNESYLFTLLEQLEYRIPEGSGADVLGWEAQGWYGSDYHRFWWKSEGESIFEGSDEGESETDFLYSRLVSPFWSVQLGAQYANKWGSDSYDDRWSGVIGLQGLAPYRFELDNSLYISERADVTLSTEIEYDIRVTQRVVLQPRAELGFAAQDVSERSLGAGMTDAKIDLRLRYEIKRGFAPYIGTRYSVLVGETANLAEDERESTEDWLLLAGVRIAF